MTPSRLRTKHRYLHSSIFFHIIQEILATEIRLNKYYLPILIGNLKKKNSLFANDMIVYIENLTKDFLKFPRSNE